MIEAIEGNGITDDNVIQLSSFLSRIIGSDTLALSRRELPPNMQPSPPPIESPAPGHIYA